VGSRGGREEEDAMLTSSQRERILSHLRRGWKLPDSLVQELWEAYEALEQAHLGAATWEARRLDGRMVNEGGHGERESTREVR
jgi:hypothetical protein